MRIITPESPIQGAAHRRAGVGTITLFLTLCLIAGSIQAQEAQLFVPKVVTAAEYTKAEQFLMQNTNPLVYGASVRPTWLSDDRFWYVNHFVGGDEFVLVDPARGTRERAFDHEKVAAALARVLGTPVKPFELPFTSIEFSEDGKSFSFNVDRRRFSCDVQGESCVEKRVAEERTAQNTVVSPDGKRAAFIRDNNLWVRDVASGQETRLTWDGVQDYGYATDNAGWTKSDRPVLVWSPDSRKIATFKHDSRGVGEMYLVETMVGHPILHAWKYPLPGTIRSS